MDSTENITYFLLLLFLSQTELLSNLNSNINTVQITTLFQLVQYVHNTPKSKTERNAA